MIGSAEGSGTKLEKSFVVGPAFHVHAPVDLHRQWLAMLPSCVQALAWRLLNRQGLDVWFNWRSNHTQVGVSTIVLQ